MATRSIHPTLHPHTAFRRACRSTSRWVGTQVHFVALYASPFSPEKAGVTQDSSDCNCLLGDACWPACADAWAELNSTVSGELILKKLLAHVCHAMNWTTTKVPAIGSSHNRFSQLHCRFKRRHRRHDGPSLQNCTPSTPREQQCELCRDAVNTINVTSSEATSAGYVATVSLMGGWTQAGGRAQHSTLSSTQTRSSTRPS